MKLLHSKLFVAVVAVAITLLAGAAGATNPFTDLGNSPHAANIDAIYNAGITSGCTATEYCPNNNVTRAQMGTFLARLGGLGKNAPHANGRGQIQSYCATARANPRTFSRGPCSVATFATAVVADGVAPVAIGVTGFPFVLVTEQDGDLVLVRCENPSCSSRTGVLVGEGASVGTNAMAIDEDGSPIFAMVGPNGALQFGRCATALCDGVIPAELDPGQANRLLDDVSIAIGGDGFPVVSYVQHLSPEDAPPSSDVLLLHCTAVDCATHGEPVKVPYDNATNPALAIAADGFPYLAFNAFNGFGVPPIVALEHCSNAGCTASASYNVTEAGQDPSIAVGLDGIPTVSFHDPANKRLVVARCADANCVTSSAVPVATSEPVAGLLSRLIIGFDGFPVIAHLALVQGDSVPVVTDCTNASCSSATTTRLGFDVANWPVSLAVGPDGVPVLAFANSSLLLARPPIS